MIAWISERSGTASTGVRSIAHRPQPTTAAVKNPIRNLLLTDHSIMRFSTFGPLSLAVVLGLSDACLASMSRMASHGGKCGTEV